MSEVKKFLEAVQNDPRAEELTKNISVPNDEEQEIALYVDLAKKMGFSVSREDLISYRQEIEKDFLARAKKAEASMEEDLNIKQLNMVAGGAKDGCSDTHKSGEWCWYNDSCQIAVRYYDDWPRQCKSNN